MKGQLLAQARTPRFSRRRRSPAPAIIIAVVVLLLGCWIFNLTCGSKKRVDTSALSEYVNRARSVIEASTSVGQTWGTIRSSLSQLAANPDGLNEQLASVEQQCLDLLEQAKALEVPEGAENAHAALLICLEQRYRAMKKYRPDLVNALTAADLDVYARNLSEDLREVAYSDGSYRFYKRAITEALEENKIEEVVPPDSIWLAEWEDASYERVKAFLVAIKGAELHGVAIGTVVLNPEGSIDVEGGEDIHRLPETEEVSITVNVENQGNRAEKDTVVTVSLYSDVDTAPSRQEQTVPTIGPGETIQVVFPGLRPAAGGVRNILEVKVGPVPQEAFIENNQKLIYFTVG